MRSLKFGAALLLVVFLHLGGVHLSDRFSSAVDLFLVLLVFAALRGDVLEGMLAGAAAGLVTDALTGGPYGLFGMIDTMIGYGIAFATQRIVVQRSVSVLLLFVLAAAAQQALLTVAALLLLPQPEGSAFVWVVVKVATSGILGLALFTADRQLRSSLATYRRSRTAKLRFDRKGEGE